MREDVRRGLRRGVVLGGLLSLSIVVAKQCPAALEPEYAGADAGRRQVAVKLVPVAEGLSQPTDLQPVPGQPDLMVVLQKKGQARWLEPDTGKTGRWFEVKVETASEQGLLGLAFHPKFTENGRFFLNYVIETSAGDVTRVAEWKVQPGQDLRLSKPTEVRTVLEVPQPYVNHNAGQLAFGPDGMLYVGLGDGGAANDPQGHGQDLGTLLGAMLRLDIDGERPYAIPKDNPFVGRDGVLPEIWAYGLRNPWRYAFTPGGELVVADVGQNKWEEVTIVRRGENHGWNKREAAHCFPPGRACEKGDLVDPVYEYGREEGISITGGYVYTGETIPELKGKYVFGDFGTGRLWAIDLPADRRLVPAKEALSLGRWPIAPASFGQDARGELYIADFNGRVLKLAK